MNETADTTTETAPPPHRPRRLERARSGRMIAGVCEGLGRYFDVDPVIFRIAFAVAAVAGGAGVLAYVVAVLVIPEEGSRRAIISLGRHTPTWVPWVLAGLGVLAVFDGLDQGGFHVGWGLFVLAVVGWFIWSHEQRSPRSAAPAAPTAPSPAPATGTTLETQPDDTGTFVLPPPAPAFEPPPEPSSILGRLTISVLLVGAGVALALGAASDGGVTGRDVEAFFGAAVLIVGVALVIGAWWGRAKALIVLGVLCTLAAATASVVDVPLRGGVGDRTWNPIATVQPAYRLGVGDATLDLTRTDATAVDTDASVGIGHLRVIVPRDATVDVDAHAGIGEVDLLGRVQDGADVDESVHVRGSELGKRITLDVRVGVGQVEVVRDAA